MKMLMLMLRIQYQILAVHKSKVGLPQSVENSVKKLVLIKNYYNLSINKQIKK